MFGAPNYLGVYLFPDPFSHFVAPWEPFLILQVVLSFSQRECSDQKTYLEKIVRSAQGTMMHPLSDPVGYSCAPGGHF